MVISKKFAAASERVARVHLLHVHRSAVGARGGKLGKAAIDQLDGNTAPTPLAPMAPTPYPLVLSDSWRMSGVAPLVTKLVIVVALSLVPRVGGEASVRRPGRIISRRDDASRLAKPAQLTGCRWRS